MRQDRTRHRRTHDRPARQDHPARHDPIEDAAAATCAPPTPPPPARHPDGIDTLRVPRGKSLVRHLRDLVLFWRPGTAPHLLARECLAAIERLTAERDAAWTQCAAAERETADA